MNPLEAGGVRPSGIGSNTDFTAASRMTMSEYVPSAATNNQVFFISDGNPERAIGHGRQLAVGCDRDGMGELHRDP